MFSEFPTWMFIWQEAHVERLTTPTRTDHSCEPKVFRLAHSIKGLIIQFVRQFLNSDNSNQSRMPAEPVWKQAP